MKKYVYRLLLAAVLLIWLPAGAKAAESGMIEIPVSVLAEGSEPDWNAVYTLELLPRKADCPMPEGSLDGIYRMALKGGSTGIIRLNCDKQGIFDYTLRQIPGKEQDCSYDNRQFHLRVERTEAIDVKAVDSENATVTDVIFRNRWSEPAWVTLTAWKSLDSDRPEDGSFAFVLLSEDGQKVAEVRNQGQRVVFPALRFGKEGIFRYEMKEVAQAGKEISCDRAVYTVFVTVQKEMDYQAEVSVRRNGKEYSGIPHFEGGTEGMSPKTGDRIDLWGMSLALSASALAGMSGYRRKRTGKT